MFVTCQFYNKIGQIASEGLNGSLFIGNYYCKKFHRYKKGEVTVKNYNSFLSNIGLKLGHALASLAT